MHPLDVFLNGLCVVQFGAAMLMLSMGHHARMPMLAPHNQTLLVEEVVSLDPTFAVTALCATLFSTAYIRVCMDDEKEEFMCYPYPNHHKSLVCASLAFWAFVALHASQLGSPHALAWELRFWALLRVVVVVVCCGMLPELPRWPHVTVLLALYLAWLHQMPLRLLAQTVIDLLLAWGHLKESAPSVYLVLNCRLLFVACTCTLMQVTLMLDAGGTI